MENGDGDMKEEDGKENVGKEEENDVGKLGVRGVVVFVRFFWLWFLKIFVLVI